MADKVLYQTDDDLSQVNLAATTKRQNVMEYVERGLNLQNYDGTGLTIDVTAGHAVMQAGSNAAYDVFPDARTGLSLTDSAVNSVYIVIDPDTQDDISIEVRTSGTPLNQYLKIGEVDTSADTVTDLARNPDGTFGSLTAADSATLSNAVLQTALDANTNDITDVGALDAASATVTASPTSATDVAIKSYVDSVAQGLDWQNSVIDEQNTPPVSPTTGDRYLIDDAPTGDWSGHPNEIAEWDGSAWEFFAPNEGWAVFLEDVDLLKVYDSADWVAFGSAIDHGALAGLTDDDHTQYVIQDGSRTADAIANTDYNEVVDTQTATSGAVTVDLSAANMHEIEADGDITISFSNVTSSPAGNSILLRFLDNDTTGPHTITWPASVEWSQGTTRNTIGQDDDLEIALRTYDGGTTWYASRAGVSFA